MSETFDAEELERMRRRQERVRRMKREKERSIKIQRFVKMALPVAVIVPTVLIICIAAAVGGKKAQGHPGEDPAYGLASRDVSKNDISGNRSYDEISAGDLSAGDLVVEGMDAAPKQNVPSGKKRSVSGSVGRQYAAHTTERTAAPPEEVGSTNVVFIDLASEEILAERDCMTVVNPASMTKVLTVLVAAEYVDDPDDVFTMTIDITDYSYSNDCSSVGFAVGEKVTVRDLFYGTILPSGADAAVALATYVAGSHEAFVELMNEKAEELGLSATAHFTNCVGLYDEQHHCTVYDMAMIMEAALDNEFCREVLNAHTYTISPTEQHPEGISISNWFLRRIEDKDTGGEVICAKTGYVVQSGNCAVSYGVDQSGRGYVCATTGAHSAWRCIYDHVALYKKYAVE